MQELGQVTKTLKVPKGIIINILILKLFKFDHKMLSI